MLLIVSGGAIWDEPAGGPLEIVDDGSSFRMSLKRFPRPTTSRRRFVNALEQIITSEPTLSCVLPSTDLFLRPLHSDYPTNRPTGSGRLFIPTSDPRHTNIRQLSGAFLNLVASGFANPHYNGTGHPIRTVTYGGAPTDQAASQFPVTTPIPDGLNIGPAGTDLCLEVYDGTAEIWHDFWKYSVTARTALSHHANPAKQQALSPRGTSASGMVMMGHSVRRHEWVRSIVNNNNPRCQHALGAAVGSKTQSPYSHPIAILSPAIVWPATSRDSSGAENVGLNPYGTLLVMPLPSENGPSKESLNLITGVNNMQENFYEMASTYGIYLVDQAKSTAAVFRADQGWTTAEQNEFIAAGNKIIPHLRIVSNVGTSGSNPIGGGTALGLNCAFDRDTPIIDSVGTWQGRYSLSSDLTAILTTDTRTWTDSWKHYESAYSMQGNLNMWRATEDTRYLDRCILYTQGIIDAARISNSLGPQGFNDTFLGWLGLTHPANPVEEAALYEVYWWRYVAIMLMEMWDRGLATSGSYVDEYNTILAFMQQNIWTKWFTRGVNSHLYRVVIHITCHAALIAMCLKDRGTTAAIRSQALTFFNNADHVGIPVSGPQPYGASIWSQVQKVHPKNPNACVWESYWRRENAVGVNHDTPDPAHPEPNFGDSAHAQAVITYVTEAYLRGLGNWDLTMLQKIMAMWLVIWPNNTTHYWWLTGPNPTVGPVTWTPNYNENAALCGFNADRSLMLRFQAQTGSANTARYGTAALAALRLGL